MTDTTIFLRFPDEATFLSLMPADFMQAGETGSPLPDGVEAISVIGNVYTGGTYDASGNVITAPALVSGWHVNALGTVPDAWQLYVVAPAPGTPVRTFTP